MSILDLSKPLNGVGGISSGQYTVLEGFIPDRTIFITKASYLPCYNYGSNGLFKFVIYKASDNTKIYESESFWGTYNNWLDFFMFVQLDKDTEYYIGVCGTCVGVYNTFAGGAYTSADFNATLTRGIGWVSGNNVTVPSSSAYGLNLKLTSGIFPLTTRTKVEDMKIGDRIPCRCKANPNTLPVFSELGTCTATEIPIPAPTTVDGLFYFIKVDKGLLIADRMVQGGISWNTLNTGKMIEGQYEKISVGKPVTYTNGMGTDETHITDINPVTSNKYLISSSSPGVGVVDNLFTVTIDLGQVYPIGLIKALLCTDAIFQWNPYAEVFYSVDNVNFLQYGTYTQTAQSSALITVAPTVKGVISARYIKLCNFIANNTYARGTVGKVEVFSNKCIRSLSGGCAYVDASGKINVSNFSKGAFPTTNEWDRYIMNSDLGGKIEKGNRAIWKFMNMFCWMKETPILALESDVNKRILRYQDSSNSNPLSVYNASTVSSDMGFLPALEYIEGEKATTLFF